MLVTREDVVAAYQAMLGRDPENDAAINAQLSADSAAAMIRSIASSSEFARRTATSPFYHYGTMFDAEGLMRQYARQRLRPAEGKVTNFLGVRIDPKFFPAALAPMAGQVEGIPIPANWHADIAEWAAVLRAVDLSGDDFTMAELGCGWACWMNNSGVAARDSGRSVHLIGIEGDEGHLAFARQACADNGFNDDQVTLHRGIAAGRIGFALFPKQERAGESWGLEPVFDADDAQRAEAAASGNYDELPMISLADVIGDCPRLDLLHIDIQGGEADLIDECMEVLDDKVAYIVIGTHSREIEGRLQSTLHRSNWRLEIERAAIVDLTADGPITRVDGVHGWRNMHILPD